MAAVKSTEQLPSSPGVQGKQTEARSQHSLVGTVLENVNRSDLDRNNYSKTNLPEKKESPDPYLFPKQLESHPSVKTMVENARNNFHTQKQTLMDIEQNLEDKEQKALFYKPAIEKKAESQSKHCSSFGPQELEHSMEINAMDINKTGSYNLEKYSNKPPVHNYKHMGDVLEKGNEFAQLQRNEAAQSLLALNESNNNILEAIRLGWNPPVDPDKEFPLKPKSAIDVPPNIRRRFGSQVCDTILPDAKKETETSDDKQKITVCAGKFNIDTKQYAAKASGSYFDVGYYTHVNLFPGHSMLNMDSIMKSAHNDVTYLRREPMTNEFRRVKDGYAVWAEQNLVREKLKKLWNAPKT